MNYDCLPVLSDSELTIKDSFQESITTHSDNMTCPSKLNFNYHCLIAGLFCFFFFFFKDANVWHFRVEWRQHEKLFKLLGVSGKLSTFHTHIKRMLSTVALYILSFVCQFDGRLVEYLIVTSSWLALTESNPNQKEKSHNNLSLVFLAPILFNLDHDDHLPPSSRCTHTLAYLVTDWVTTTKF